MLKLKQKEGVYFEGRHKKMTNKDRIVLIKTEKLCKSFSKKNYNEHILKNIDLEIYEKDFTVIMGASGSGKSTLLYMLSGMDNPSLGRVFFRNEEISNKTNDELSIFRKNHCGFIFQQINLVSNLTVLDNIVMCGLLKDKRNAEVLKKAKHLLSIVNIDEKNWSKSPSEISGGEAQRVAVVRAEINEPDILFADEPTGALNSEAGNRVLKLLTDIHKQGRNILMVTHDFNAALRGSRVLYLKDGIICGECNLGEYDGGGELGRNKRLSIFLKEMGW